MTKKEKEEILCKETFKGDVEEMEKRIFYTLTQEKNLQTHRIAKLISMLIKKLHDKKVLKDDDIDDLLLECIG